MAEQHDETGKNPRLKHEGLSREDQEFIEAIRELPEEVKAPPNFHEKVMETIKQRQWVKDEAVRREQKDTKQER